jgi:hypothetical protein
VNAETQRYAEVVKEKGDVGIFGDVEIILFAPSAH